MNQLAVLNNQPKELMFLGEKGLCKYTDEGILKAISVDVKLYMSKNHIYEQPGGKGKAPSYKITSEGYERINRFANLQEVPEPTMEIGGQTFPNPYVSLDAFGKKDKVYQKVTLAGRDTNGDIKFSTALIISDASDLLISEISNKLRWDNDEKLGYYSTKEEYEEDKANGVRGLKYIPLDEDSGIVVKLRSSEYRALKANVDDKRSTIERKTHTIAKRNAFRKHPSTSFYTVSPHALKDDNGQTIDIYAVVQVIKWVNESNEELQQAIKDYLDHKKDDQFVEKFTDTDDDFTDLEEGQELPDDYVTLDESIQNLSEVSEQAVELKVNKEDDQERSKLMKYIDESFDILGPDTVNEVLNDYDMENVTIVELKSIKNQLNSIIDGGQA